MKSGQIRTTHLPKEFKNYILLIFLFLLFYMYITPCQCELVSVRGSDSESIFNTFDSSISGSYDASEKNVYIGKTLIHNSESHLPNEKLCIFVEIKFSSGEKWILNNLIINEFIDKDLNADPASLRWTIIDDITALNKYRNDLSALELKNANAIWGNNNSNFTISVPNNFDSSCRLIFWYNVTIKKPGTFDIRTILMSNPGIDIYSDVEKSFKIYATSYDIITPYFQTLKELLWILVVFSGIFTFYKQIIRKDRLEGLNAKLSDSDLYHLPDFFKEMINEIEILIKAIPAYLIVILFLALEAILIYIYISSLYPSLYPSIGEYVERNWTLIRGVSPIIATLLITLALLYIKKGPKGLLHDACVYLENISPMEAIILILNYHLFIFSLFIIIKQFY